MKKKNIKNTFKIFLAISILVFSTSCKREFLNVEPQGQITADAITKDPNLARQLVTGVYNKMYQGGFGDNMHGILWEMAADVASDDADKGSTPSDQSPQAVGFDNFTSDLNSNNFYVNNLWRGYYNGIAAANQALDALPKATFDNTTKTILIGETRFLRGYFYFNMVRLFGGVPLVLRVPSFAESNSDEFQKRASKDSVYAAIVADLQYAVDNLPLKGDPTTQVGRANKGAAQSLLAKVYLYQKNYQKAYDLTQAVLTSGKYSLMPDYSLNFRSKANDNNNESIFEVQTGVDANCSAAIPFFSVAQGPRAGGLGGWRDLGFGLNTPSSDLANAYEAGDLRKAATIIFISTTGGTVLWDGFRVPRRDSVENDRYNYKAYFGRLVDPYCGNGNTDNLPKNYHIMRYAEVLLINAEAAIQVGHMADAITDMNLVRSRAGLPPTAVTQASIWKERRVELAMEEDRFFDIVRQGRAGQILRALGKSFVDGKNEVFPIPQPQIDLSGGKLIQNPGY